MNLLLSALAVLFVALWSIGKTDGYASRREPLKDEEPSNDIIDNIKQPAKRTNSLYNKFVEIEKFPKRPLRLQPGTPSQISCVVKGSPAPAVVWLKNNQPIEEETILNDLLPVSDRSFASMTSTLVLNSVSAVPEDVYTCLATAGENSEAKSVIVYSGVDDAATDIEAANRELAAEPAKPVITYYFSNLLDAMGSSALFPCRAVGNPTPSIEWRNASGRKIINSSRIRVLENGDLFVRNLLWKDLGGFTCYATNEYGQDKQEVFVYPFLLNEKDSIK